MDHTAYPANTTYRLLPRKHSPDGATMASGSKVKGKKHNGKTLPILPLSFLPVA